MIRHDLTSGLAPLVSVEHMNVCVAAQTMSSFLFSIGCRNNPCSLSHTLQKTLVFLQRLCLISVTRNRAEIVR